MGSAVVVSYRTCKDCGDGFTNPNHNVERCLECRV